MMRHQIESAVKECEKLASTVKSVPSDTFKKLYGTLRPLPAAMKNFSSYSKQVHGALQEIEEAARSLEVAMDEQQTKAAQDLMAANKDVYELQVELA